MRWQFNRVGFGICGPGDLVFDAVLLHCVLIFRFADEYVRLRTGKHPNVSLLEVRSEYRPLF
jgi:hypothetical protein